MRRVPLEDMLKRYRATTLTAREVAFQLLFDWVFVEPPPGSAVVVSDYRSLPTQVERELRRLLLRIRDDGFRWAPHVIGGAPPSANPDRLRDIWARLEIGLNQRAASDPQQDDPVD